MNKEEKKSIISKIDIIRESCEPLQHNHKTIHHHHTHPYTPIYTHILIIIPLP